MLVLPRMTQATGAHQYAMLMQNSKMKQKVWVSVCWFGQLRLRQQELMNALWVCWKQRRGRMFERRNWLSEHPFSMLVLPEMPQAARTQEPRNRKAQYCWHPCTNLLSHITHDPKFEGSNQAAFSTGRRENSAKSVWHWIDEVAKTWSYVQGFESTCIVHHEKRKYQKSVRLNWQSSREYH